MRTLVAGVARVAQMRGHEAVADCESSRPLRRRQRQQQRDLRRERRRALRGQQLREQPRSGGMCGVRLAPREQRAAQIGAGARGERREREPAVDDGIAGRPRPASQPGSRGIRPKSFAGWRGSRARPRARPRVRRACARRRPAARRRTTPGRARRRRRAALAPEAIAAARPASRVPLAAVPRPTRAARAALCSFAAVQPSRRCVPRRRAGVRARCRRSRLPSAPIAARSRCARARSWRPQAACRDRRRRASCRLRSRRARAPRAPPCRPLGAASASATCTQRTPRATRCRVFWLRVAARL